MEERRDKTTASCGVSTQEGMKKLVVIGGGTGTFTILQGLKKYDLDITAIVSMADDGGSTGILRNEFGILPPGDIRKCIVALSESSESLQNLFNYRFTNGCVRGHSLGNLLITALQDIKGSYEEGIKEASRILNIKGKVLPVSYSNCRLCAELEDDQLIVGETNIDIPKHDGNLKIKRVFLTPKAVANHHALNAIKEADIIVIGPGDLFSSIISNLVVEGITDNLKESKAIKVYVCNLMTKFGETNDFRASDFVNELERYLGKGVIDHVLINQSDMDKELLKKYAEEKAFPVSLDKENLAVKNIIVKDLITQPILIRHDSYKLAKAIMEIIEN